MLKLVSAGVYKINAPGLTSAGTLPADVIPSFVAGGLQMLTDLPALGVGECALALVQMNSAVSGIYLQAPAANFRLSPQPMENIAYRAGSDVVKTPLVCAQWPGVDAVDKVISASLAFTSNIDERIYVTNPSFYIPGSLWSLEFFVKVPARHNPTALFNSSYGGNNGAGGIRLEIESSGKLLFTPVGSGMVIESSGVISLNTWTHVLIEHFEGNTYLYIGGSLDSTAADTFAYDWGCNNPLMIGGSLGGDVEFDGKLEAFCLRNSVLALGAATCVVPTALQVPAQAYALCVCRGTSDGIVWHRIIDN